MACRSTIGRVVACADEHTLTRPWTATDLSGGSASATPVVTVFDTAAPRFAGVPADATFACDAAVPARGDAARTSPGPSPPAVPPIRSRLNRLTD